MLEFAGVIVLGIIAQWIAWRMKVPAILPLILIGLFVGPISTLWTTGGEKWIEPVWNDSRGLFAGESLFYFVELAIGVILFEGGLTLKRDEVLELGGSIIKLISLGSLVTFIGGGIITHFLLDLSWPISFLFSALIIVTGPTVIAPILRNIPLKQNVSTVLKWEGILIDPIGALVAVLVFEFISTFAGEGHFTTEGAIKQFVTIILLGFALGYFAAMALRYLLKRNWIPHYLLNVFTLAFVLAVFVISDMLASESGLLTVVIFGMVLGNSDVPNIKEILYFKESISILLISVLFVLLSANIDMQDLYLLQDWRIGVLFLVVILMLRPLGVLLSTRGSALNLNEKMFIGWVGPRGIVAAGIASLFGIKLTKMGVVGANYITPLVFMIVLGTVLLNATTARMVAKWLNVLLEKSNGILIVGANKAARLIGKYIHDHGRHIVLIDSNKNNVEAAKKIGLQSFVVNIYSDDLTDNIELNDIGFLLALTGSTEVNKYATEKYSEDFGENGTYRLISAEELKDPNNNPNQGLFSKYDDYLNLSEIVRDNPTIHEYPLRSQTQLDNILESVETVEHTVPVIIKKMDGSLDIITLNPESTSVVEGDTLVVIGDPIEMQDFIDEEEE